MSETTTLYIDKPVTKRPIRPADFLLNEKVGQIDYTVAHTGLPGSKNSRIVHIAKITFVPPPTLPGKQPEPNPGITTTAFTEEELWRRVENDLKLF